MAEFQVNEKYTNRDEEASTWNLYLYATKSPVTKQKNQKRLEKFLNFVGVSGETIEEKGISVVLLSRDKGNAWTFKYVLKFMQTIREI